MKVYFAILYLTVILGCLSCSLESDSGRSIRAHTSMKGGVSHAEPSLSASRYCQQCHGSGLQGGSSGEPSCYQCHGRNWNEADPQTSLAPADHTQLKGTLNYKHHPDLISSSATCQSCHGTSLEGTGKNGRPSCFLCHSQLWN